MGTFFFGYLTVFGGEVLDNREKVDGHECVIIEYPNIGTDLKYRFYLDPEFGYIPRKLEQYVERKLYRTVDSYRYEPVDGVYLPVSVTITDFAVKKPHTGKVVGTCVMNVKPGTIRLNEATERYSGLFKTN
jgi:hypothetical protein